MNTPGPGGYLLAIMVSAGVLDVEVLVLTAPDQGGADLPAVFVRAYLLILLVALPVGGIGALLVELACRRQPQQWVHVLAAFCSAYVIAFWLLILWMILGEASLVPAQLPHALAWVLPVALAGAAGRAAVIPLVGQRRAVSA